MRPEAEWHLDALPHVHHPKKQAECAVDAPLGALQLHWVRGQELAELTRGESRMRPLLRVERHDLLLVRPGPTCLGAKL